MMSERKASSKKPATKPIFTITQRALDSEWDNDTKLFAELHLSQPLTSTCRNQLRLYQDKDVDKNSTCTAHAGSLLRDANFSVLSYVEQPPQQLLMFLTAD